MKQQSLELYVGDTANTSSEGKTARRLSFLYDLISQFGTKKRLNGSLQTMVERLVDEIPGAEHGALVLGDRESNQLLLQAYMSSDGPTVDIALVYQTMEQRKGCIWRRSEACDGSDDMTPFETAMYVPLLWQSDVLGVLCVDSSHRDPNFTTEDLQFTLAVANCAAIALVTRQLQEELQQMDKLLKRLLKNFSSRAREKTVERARNGELRPGGRISELTILYADIRNFTQMSAEKDPAIIVDILSDYFSMLSKIIVTYDGTIDKYIGDEILAVFGSPEADLQQYEKSVRAAWKMQAALKTLNAERTARGEIVCEIGIGIHSGEVFHGWIGADERIEFTVIGDAVNKASRYCDAAGPGEILISPELYQHVWQIVKQEPTTIETKHEGPLTAHHIKDVKRK